LTIFEKSIYKVYPEKQFPAAAVEMEKRAKAKKRMYFMFTIVVVVSDVDVVEIDQFGILLHRHPDQEGYIGVRDFK